jgi:hypothetical protein
MISIAVTIIANPNHRCINQRINLDVLPGLILSLDGARALSLLLFLSSFLSLL